MKKLLTAMLLSAGVSIAYAQSSVSVYGILDEGYSNVSTRIGTTKTQTSKFDQGPETSNRLGFKGNEDLGGGTSAIFTVEFQVYPEDATVSGNSNSGLLNRQSFAGLKKNGLGEATIGTQYTPMHRAVSATDPGQSNNATGSIIYPANGSQVTTDAYTIRASNAVMFQSDDYKGFRLGGLFTQNNKDTTQTGANTGGTTNVNGYGLNADYTVGKLYAVASYQSLRNETQSSTTATPVPTAMTNNFGTNVVNSESYLGATYDFGILKAYAGRIDRKVTSVLDSSQYIKRSGQQIGVRGYFTPVVEGWASVGNGKYSAYGAGQPTANFVGYQLGANYYLSKRTNLYGIFGSTYTTNENGATSAGATQLATGIRHTF